MAKHAEAIDQHNLDIIYTEIKDRLQEQFDQLRALDQKAGQVLSSASLIVAVGIGLQAIETSPSSLRFTLFIMAIIFYALSVISAWLAYRVQSFRRDPEPRPLRDHYLPSEFQFTKRKIISNFIESYEFNQQSIRSKVRYTQSALLFFLLESLLLAATVLVPQLRSP